MKAFLTLFIILLFPVTAFCATSHSWSNSPICEGYTLDLFDTGTTYSASATYFWHGPGGFTSTMEYPVITGATAAMAGTYTCIRNGTDSTTTVVVVRHSPPVPFTDTLFPTCSGSTLNLTAFDTVGCTYLWNGPNGFTSTLQSTSIVGITTAGTGTYTISATLAGCTSSYTVYALIDSTPATPVASCTTPTPICSSETLNFTSSSATPGVTYSWVGPDGFASTISNPSIPAAGTINSGNYTVTVTEGICSSHTVVSVTVNQTPSTPTLTSTAPVCSGGLLSLGATATPGTGTYYWSGPNSFTASVQFPSILPVTTYATGLYFVYEIVDGCSSPLANIYVLINPSPDVPVEWSNSPICQGDSLKLYSFDDSSAVETVSFSWAGPSGYISLSQDPLITNAPVTASGIYTVTATIGTCTASQQITVSVIPAPPLTATSNSPVCTGDTLKLFATSAAGNTYSWTGPYSFTSAGGGPTRFPTIPEDAGVYVVTVTDDNGCKSVGYDTVLVNNTPNAPWVTWPTYCQYAYSPPLMAIDATNVQWFSTDVPMGGVTTAPIPSTAVPGVFFYYLNQTQNGCPSAIDSIQVIVNPKPVVALAPAFSTICPHDSINYATEDGDPFDTYKWVPSLYLSDSTIANPVARPIGSLTYKLITTNEYNCKDTEYAQVTVFPAGVIEIGAGDSIVLFPGQTYHFQPLTNCTSFTWFPPVGLDNPNVSDPVASPAANTVYYVYGLTEHGCPAVDSVAFHVNSETLYGVPNAFTPGASINSVLRIYTLGTATLNHFRIFNRWGQMVFETNNIDDGWDGTFNGANQPYGVYVYEIQAVSGVTGKLVNMNGNITLIR